jgi:surfeit locus 1 family protein
VSGRTLAFVIFAVAVSAGCARLGIWQLHRLDARRARNAVLAERMASAPKPVRDVLRDTATASFRRATAIGSYDFANEFALGARTHEGSPGVNIVTPLRVAGTDTAILVNRGWVYAPDAMITDFARWRESESASVTGYLTEIPSGGHGPVATPSASRSLRRLDRDSLAVRLPYPVAPFVLVASGAPGDSVGSVPARLPPPLLDEGPHLGYALQWFGFALIALAGAGFSVYTERRGARGHGSQRALPRIRHPATLSRDRHD